MIGDHILGPTILYVKASWGLPECHRLGRRPRSCLSLIANSVNQMPISDPDARVAWPEVYRCRPGVADTVNIEFSQRSMRKYGARCLHRGVRHRNVPTMWQLGAAASLG
jgi:hypothetical protein